jgi:hypothetical protein
MMAEETMAYFAGTSLLGFSSLPQDQQNLTMVFGGHKNDDDLDVSGSLFHLFYLQLRLTQPYVKSLKILMMTCPNSIKSTSLSMKPSQKQSDQSTSKKRGLFQIYTSKIPYNKIPQKIPKKI